MADLTRRGFLAQMSITGVGIAGGLGLRQMLLSPHGEPQGESSPSVTTSLLPNTPTMGAPATGLSLDTVSLAGPMVLHVRDVATAEIAMMVGTQELIYRDPELVSRLVKTAASANTAEG
jgi:hypothetical protein